MKRTQLLWETNKLSETEAKLHQSQQEHAKLRKDQTKLRMRHQEMVDKLEQGTRKKIVMKHFVCGDPSPILGMHTLLHAAHTTSKQLEAEKRFLEEELEQRGRGKQRNQIQTSSDSQTSSDTQTPAILTVHNEELTSERAAAKLPSRKRKEINILVDLDKENLSNPSPCVDLKEMDRRVSLDKNLERTRSEDHPVSL